ncbi:hypothetical protein VQ056_23745 [Paenibacillus sp. JTLBN-2024]
MSSFMEAIYPVDRQNDGMSLQDEGQARACSLPEIASLVELVRIESMTKEEAIRAADPHSIGSLLREAEPFSGDQGDLGAPELLLGWCDDARGMGIFAEDWTYPPEQAEALSGTAGLTLLREDDWLARGHLKEIYEEWIMQYAGLSGRPHPSIALQGTSAVPVERAYGNGAASLGREGFTRRVDFRARYYEGTSERKGSPLRFKGHPAGSVIQSRAGLPPAGNGASDRNSRSPYVRPGGMEPNP